MSIEAREAIALWEPDMDGEIELADSLNNEVVLMVNALKTEHRRNKESMAAARHADRVDQLPFQQHECDTYRRMATR